MYINGFKNVAFSTIPVTLLAYWRLNEINDGSVVIFTDSAPNSTLTYNPTVLTPLLPVSTRMNMSEIYLKICPEG